MTAPKLSVGDWVEVRSKEEILRTLDDKGHLDGMPFMPEMFAFCGRKFEVFKRAHKTCDTVFPTRSRRVDRAVHLETRCNGEAHGGCQAACLIFWKEAWLKPASSNSSDRAVITSTRSTSADPPGCSESDVRACAQATVPSGEPPVYVCQATQLPYATLDLDWWDIRQYLEDYRSGNVGLWRILSGFVFSIYYHIKQTGIGVGPAMEWFYDRLHPIWRGTLFPWKVGTIPDGQPTPTAALDLQPGELVRVRSHDQILRTVNADLRNRGMKWDAELVPYCGGTYRVLKRVTKIINEKTGQIQEMKTASIILDSVVCEARYSNCRLFCPRAIYPYWREIWLERVPQSTHAPYNR